MDSNERKFRITLEITTVNGNPEKWNWHDLIDEQKVEIVECEEKEN